MNTDKLEHFVSGEPNKGLPFVLVLQDGAKITAEDRAMLQALYSRSPASVMDHLTKLADVGSGKFMEQFYVGYGHKSIGDCGDTTIFIENVSMLAAKAIQDWALYNGQEVSTRYVDFTSQPFVDPLEKGFENPQDEMRAFYVRALPLLKEDLKKRYKQEDGEKDVVYEKAIAARAFDILRGFLPAGAQTSLSWTTNLRQAADKLAYLKVHPLNEVQCIALLIQNALKQAHPHSFNHKEYQESNDYRSFVMKNYYYFDKVMSSNVVITHNGLDHEMIYKSKRLLSARPEKTELPKMCAEMGSLQFEFLIDFGSFRDIQRQRAVAQRMPLLTPNHGFHIWYLEELPHQLREEALTLLERVNSWHTTCIALEEDIHYLQYYLPMGYNVPCRITGDVPALVYLAELRSGVMVHPTLRPIAQQIGLILESFGVKVYIDKTSNGRFDVRRGEQDIVNV